jgi:hypothetical protein
MPVTISVRSSPSIRTIVPASSIDSTYSTPSRPNRTATVCATSATSSGVPPPGPIR